MLFRNIPGIAKPVSVLSIGSWRTFEKMEFDAIVAVLRACFDAGINFIDDCRYGTAEGVPPGIPTNEVIVGRAMSEIGLPRSSYHMANKMWWDLYPKLSLREQLLKSLTRLDDEYVDLLYIDRPDRLHEAQPHYSFQYDELVCSIAEEMQRLRQEGLIRSYGFANAKPDAMARILAITDRHHLWGPSVAQIRYNLTEPEASLSPQLRSLHASHGLMLAATTTMAGGVLTAKYLDGAAPPSSRFSLEKARENASAMAVSSRLAELSGAVGLPAAALAMSFPLINPAVATVVFGARSVEQVRQNLRALDAGAPDVQRQVAALATT